MRPPPPPLPEHPDALALREFALGYPDAWEDFPWEHRAMKVRKKVFCFFAEFEDRFRISMKLPESAPFLLTEPFARPTPYNLGKSGWVTCELPLDGPLPLARMKAWVDGSYRAVALKGLIKTLGAPLTDPGPE